MDMSNTDGWDRQYGVLRTLDFQDPGVTRLMPQKDQVHKHTLG